MTKVTETKAIDNARLLFTDALNAVLSANGSDPLRVASNRLALPFSDELGINRWYVITISVPKGSRDGEAYDGQVEAEDYAFKQAEKEKARLKAEEKKAKKTK